MRMTSTPIKAVPRGPDGDFLPPQYRLTSVRAGDLKPGDVVSWNHNGQAHVCAVRRAELLTTGEMAVLLTHPDFDHLAVVGYDTTVNRAEVLW
jgi:hypothetical protein